MRRHLDSITPLVIALVHAVGVLQPAIGQTNVFPSSGNVGIGTVAPVGLLEVKLPYARLSNQMTLGSSAGVGWAMTGDGSFGLYGGVSFSGYSWLQAGRTDTATSYSLSLQPSGGNVGIGTTSPQYKLAVNGSIGAQDIIVTNAGWADYVFRPGYGLRPLSEVSAYIQKHRHLPDIPTEAEVKEKGISVGDMQSKLLAKVEELTLHMIRAEQDNRELREQNADLQRRVASLEAKR